MEIKITNADIQHMVENHLKELGINTDGKQVKIRTSHLRKSGGNEAFVWIGEKETTKEEITVVLEDLVEEEEVPIKTSNSLFE